MRKFTFLAMLLMFVFVGCTPPEPADSGPEQGDQDTTNLGGG